MTVAHHDVSDLIFRRCSSKDATEREELEGSIRYLYRWLSDREFGVFIFLTDCAAVVGRALGLVLFVLGLGKMNLLISEKLRGDSHGRTTTS